MKSCSTLRLLLTSTVVLFVAQACQQQVADPTPNAFGNDKVALLANGLTNALTDAQAIQAARTFHTLSYEEMERYIDRRHTNALQTPDADVIELMYWRDWSHAANQLAHQQTGKSYAALDAPTMRTLLGQMPARFQQQRSGATKTAFNQPVLMNQTTSCAPWSSNTSLAVNQNPAGSLILGSYIGARNLNGTSSDCDYVFRFTIDRVNRPTGIRSDNLPNVVFCNISTGCTGTISAVAARTDDSNPGSDCGTFTYEVLLGADRVNAAFFGNPMDAAQFLRIGVQRQPKTGWCYTGAWGSEKWHLGGIYRPEWDNWGRNNSSSGWLPCACNNGGWLR